MRKGADREARPFVLPARRDPPRSRSFAYCETPAEPSDETMNGITMPATAWPGT